MLDKIKEIEACNYECEAGKLDLNVAWQELKEKAERYEKALKFYANKENYECDNEELNPVVSYIHIVDMDGGENARKALGIEK
jgi:hypothetical protein